MEMWCVVCGVWFDPVNRVAGATYKRRSGHNLAAAVP
jgi:hypothetical protein